jgi:hypothetical protein
MGADEVRDAAGEWPWERLLSEIGLCADALESLDLSEFTRDELHAMAETIGEISEAIQQIKVRVTDDDGGCSSPTSLGELLDAFVESGPSPS